MRDNGGHAWFNPYEDRDRAEARLARVLRVVENLCLDPSLYRRLEDVVVAGEQGVRGEMRPVSCGSMATGRSMASSEPLLRVHAQGMRMQRTDQGDLDEIAPEGER